MDISVIVLYSWWCFRWCWSWFV